MMEQIILGRGPQSLAFERATLRTHEGWPALEQPARVVWCPEKETVGVVSLKGHPQFAAALIERQLRQSGEVDGEAKVLVHQVLRHRDSYSALYSAVPLNQWQAFQSWLDEQPVLCLAFSWIALLHDGLSDGQARVVQDGTRLIYLARHARQFSFFNVVAFSDRDDDLEAAGRSLAVQLMQSRSATATATPASGVDAVQWLPTLDRPAGGAAQRGFEDATRATCRMQQQTFQVEGTDEARCSGVPAAAWRLSPRHGIGPQTDRWLYMLERFSVPAALGCIAAGAALSALGANWWWQAEQQSAQALKIEASLQSPAGPTAAAAQAAPVKDGVARQLDFQREALRLAEGIDLHGVLAALGDASASRVRILSVRLEDKPASKAPAAPLADAVATPDIFIEGLLPETREPGDGLLSGFVQQLNAAGWRVEPAEYRGSSNGGSMAGRLFAFKLLRSGAPGDHGR